MAYTTPTLADFRIRYPAFAATADATIEAWLADGDAGTTNWPDDDRARAVMLFAAHNLSIGGQGGAIPAGVTSFKSGTFSATLSDAAASRTGYSATVYGREYLDLVRRHFAGPFSAWSVPTNV